MLPGTPAFAGVTISLCLPDFHFESGSKDLFNQVVLLEQADDFVLLRFCLWRAGATATPILCRERHWRRAALVLASDVGATVEEGPHDCGASSAVSPA
jgi:hypothetical protein